MKKILARIETYENQNGETKNKYAQIGIIQESKHGEYCMIDPIISLSGVLMKQNIMAANKGEQERNMIMCSVFVDDNKFCGNKATPHGGQGKQYNPSNTDDDKFSVNDEDVPF